MKKLKVKELVLGSGRPKVAVPLTANTSEQLLCQAKQAKDYGDLIEWRIDFFDDVLDFEALAKAASAIKEILGTTPLLMTFRSAKEGGVKEISEAQYFEICNYIVTHKLADLLDVELFWTTAKVKQLVALAHQYEVKIIMSNHDFAKTPPTDELLRRFHLMAAYGADIVKIAVMPHSTLDVLNLLEATTLADAKLAQPVISMSMGDLGKISRVCGEVFGSCVTFGAVGQASAPGQIEATKLKEILQALKVN